MKIVILGGTGLIGKALVKKLLKKNYEVWVFGKNPQFIKSIDPRIKTTFWRAGQDINPYFLKNTDVIVNLAGASINQPWTVEAKREIYHSRISPIKDIIAGLKFLPESKNPPAYIASSAVGYYPYDLEKVFKPSDVSGGHFLAQICKEQEEAAFKQYRYFSRVLFIRTGIVLSPEGGFEKEVSYWIKKGLGVYFGQGDNFLSSIKLSEIVRLYEDAIENSYAQGIIHGVSRIDTQKNILDKIAQKYQTKIKFTMPVWIVKFFFGERSEMLLGSQKAEPHSSFTNKKQTTYSRE